MTDPSELLRRAVELTDRANHEENIEVRDRLLRMAAHRGHRAERGMAGGSSNLDHVPDRASQQIGLIRAGKFQRPTCNKDPAAVGGFRIPSFFCCPLTYQRSSPTPTPTLTPGARKPMPARGPSSQSR